MPLERRLTPVPRLTPAGAWFDVLLLVLLTVLTVALAARTPLLSLDIGIRNFADDHRPPGAGMLARIFNYLGQGTPLTLLCLGIAMLQLRRLRRYEPLLTVVCAFLLSYLSIGALKLFTDRGAPHYGSILLFSEPTGRSYPSGHAANVLVWYGVLALLLAPYLWPWARRLLRYAPVILVSFATTYLGYHWGTDTIAGLLIGVLIYRAVRRRPWRQWPWLMVRIRRREAAVAPGRVAIGSPEPDVAPDAEPDADRWGPVGVDGWGPVDSARRGGMGADPSAG
jgi:membrane-associated phospholipid phosphatase